MKHLILLILVFLSGCSSVPASMTGDMYSSGYQHSAITYKVEVGDDIVVRIKEGLKYEFRVTKITEHQIIGEDVIVNIDDISAIEIKVGAGETIAYGVANFVTDTAARLLGAMVVIFIIISLA